MEFNQNPNPQPSQGPSYQQPPQGQYQQGYSQPYQSYPQYSSPINQNKPSGMAIASMVLGICSIFFSAGFITGLICAILAIVFAGKVTKQAPGGNLGASQNFVKAGKICGIVGLVFSILFAILWTILIIATVLFIQEATPYLMDELSPYLNGNIDIQISATSLPF